MSKFQANERTCLKTWGGGVWPTLLKVVFWPSQHVHTHASMPAHTHMHAHNHTQVHREMASIWGDRHANYFDLVIPHKHMSKHGIHELYNNYLSWVILFSAHILTQSIQNYWSKIIYSVSSCPRVFYFLESGVWHRSQCLRHWRAGERA